MKTERLLNAIGCIDDKLIADAENDKTTHLTINWRKFGLVAACLVLVICAGISTCFIWNNMTVGAFTMDVNPSIEYILAKNGTVKNVNYLNSDAEEALRNVEIKKQTVEVALARTVDAYENCGYTDKSKGTVLVSFDSRINSNIKLKDKLASTIRDALEQTKAVEALVFHVDSDNEQAVEIAQEYNISRGKADCIIAASNNTGMAAEELSKLTLDELLILQEDLDITPFDSNYIGIQKAKQIALKDAGYINKKFFREEKLMDPESKSPYYHLVFDDNNIRWTYYINAIYGTIMEKSYVYISGDETPIISTSNDDIGTSDLITLEYAKIIALKHAGLYIAEIPVIFTEEELIPNNGDPYYLLEFYDTTYQYFYKIDAKDGSILDGRRYILLSEAKRIAINDAGIITKIVFKDEILIDGGIKTPYYQLVFYDNHTQWNYNIDAVLAIILKKEVLHIGAGTGNVPEADAKDNLETNNDNNTTERIITLEAAKAIALKHAGLTGLNIKIVFTEEELLLNQGNPYYMLEFYTSEYLYRYKINAQSGEILFNRRYILLSEAKKIALEDSGSTGSVTYSDETLVDGGIKTPYYRLVFYNNQCCWTYLIDAEFGTILEKNKENTFSVEFISLEKAKAIALKKAGLENADVVIIFTKQVLVRDQGDPYYHFEFNTSNFEYFYKIDAQNGDVLFGRRYIKLSEAKKIAVTDTGTNNAVTFTDETLVEIGPAIPYYRLVFTDNQTNWTYHISALNGEILGRSNDSVGETVFITLDGAKAIALKHAGLESVSDKIKYTKEALMRNNGEPYYHLEFYTPKYNYYYKIDATTGEILESGKYMQLFESKKIAIKDAGVTDDVNFTEEKLVDGGIKTPYYSFIFDNKKTRWTYRIDAILGTILEKSNDDIFSTEFISLDSAKAIALKDAGLENADVVIVFTKQLLIRDQGDPYYQLEFNASVYEYYYKIDAKTGDVIFGKKHMRLFEAKKVALDNAGITDKVSFTEEKLVDGGIKTPYYQLIFDDSQTRWTYRIDAVLGTILEKSTENIGSIEFITVEKAKAIAIRDAGLENVNTKIVFICADLHRNQGKPCYLLQFHTGNYQYIYKIDAVTGDILEKSIELLLKTDSEEKTDLSVNSDS